ncbi:MAG: hypothetical protein FJW34_12530 [Acidobacteria bacterium]|nr:hypothetical protein [Acidobacteriota bacterium]
MPRDHDRRRFLKKSLTLSCAAGAGLTFDHLALVERLNAGQTPAHPKPATAAPPMSKIGKLTVTRLLCGGNLFSGFAHSGDLLYVSSLLKHYFTDQKVMDTLQSCEESGINAAILRTDDHMIGILNRYRKDRGGRIQWIAQTYPTIDNLKDNIQRAIDNGAVGAFPMGGNADTLFKKGRLDLLAEVVSFIRHNGLAAGIGSHSLDLPMAAEKAKLDPDFYFKTFNAVGYESQTPAEIAAFMNTVKKPWVAFKVLGAGRVKPREGLDLAFRLGADFIAVGMYDFQVAEDAALVREIVPSHSQRQRPWSA